MRERRAAALGAIVAGACLAAAAIAGTGCGPPPGPPPIGHHLHRPRHLARLNRVVMVELAYTGRYDTLRRDMTGALAAAIRQKDLFGLEVVSADRPELHDLPLHVGRRKTLKGLVALRKALGCDALLIGSIERFEPYPRMQIGLHLQLLDLRRGQLIWDVEHTWDTADRATGRRIRRFFRKRIRDDYGPANWHLVTVSPRLFEKFVAHEVAGTLGEDPGPPPQTTLGELLVENLERIRDH